MVRNTARIKSHSRAASIRDTNECSQRVFSHAVRKAFMPSLPFPRQGIAVLFVELRARQAAAAFRRCYDPAANRFTTRWRTMPFTQSGKSRAALVGCSIPKQKLSTEFRFTSATIAYFTGPMPPLSTGCYAPCVVDQTQSRKKRRLLQRRFWNFFASVYPSAQTGKQKVKSIGQKEEQNGRFTIWYFV
ncbi:hypothetical protein KCP78_00530 [Salmonella enterica subsp. enterica]|nr:hypothetical protein KCP78_00530 [Salmonella enterica subsp. enterica]